MNSASTRAAIGASRPRSRNSPGSYNEKRTAARSYAARSNSTQQSPANSSPAACPTASAAEGGRVSDPTPLVAAVTGSNAETDLVPRALDHGVKEL
jgi:hypothetical protein